MYNRRRCTTNAAKVVCLASFLMIFSASAAADSLHHRLVSDVDFYLAVIPAEITQNESAHQSNSSQHETRYHVILALFDSTTGKRISNAEIQATIGMTEGKAQQHKKLEPMLIMNAASYGNYFTMTDAGRYHLRFNVRTPIRKYAFTAEFIFDRPKD